MNIKKMDPPTRKEINMEQFQDLVTVLAEYRADERGDLIIMGELFYSLFDDLSAAKQEKYIRYLRSEIKDRVNGGLFKRKS